MSAFGLDRTSRRDGISVIQAGPDLLSERTEIACRVTWSVPTFTQCPDQDELESVKDFADVKKASFDPGLLRAGVVIFAQRPGLTRFVRASANRGAQYHVGARLLWVGVCTENLIRID